MNLQIVGKVRLALSPFEPQWANVPLYLTSRGFTTTPMASADLIFQIDVDLIDHQVVIATAQGETRRVPLAARAVADFYADFMSNLNALGVRADIRPIPDEVSDPIPFAEDSVHATYEPERANRFWRILAQVDLVLKEHRSRFRGRSSPVHFFWGTFDLAYTRFSGRPAEPPPGVGIIERLSADAEQICAGFWPGSDRFQQAAFYAYTYPKPEGIEDQVIGRAGTRVLASSRCCTKMCAGVGRPETRCSSFSRAPMPRAPACVGGIRASSSSGTDDRPDGCSRSPRTAHPGPSELAEPVELAEWVEQLQPSQLRQFVQRFLPVQHRERGLDPVDRERRLDPEHRQRRLDPIDRQSRLDTIGALHERRAVA